MKGIRYILPIIVLLIFQSCNSSKRIEGYWAAKYGYSKNDTVFLLVNYKDGILRNYNSFPEDTSRYYRLFNNLFVRNYFYNDVYRIKINIRNDSLILTRPKVDTIIFSYKRCVQNNIVNEILTQNNFNIELPDPRDYSVNSMVGLESKKQIFIPLIEDSKIIYYNGQSYILDSLLFKIFAAELSGSVNSFDFRKITISIFADKRVPLTTLKLLHYNLKAAGLLKINYVLRSKERFDFVNGLTLKVPPSTELEQVNIDKIVRNDKDLAELPCFLEPPPPPPPPYNEMTVEQRNHIKKRLISLELSNGNIKLLNDTINENIESIIKNKLLNEPKTIIGYHLQDNATYQDYINLHCLVRLIVYNLRNEYCLEKFGKKYSDTYGEEQDMAIDKYPLMITDLNEHFMTKI
ncbi:hypothetical protein ES705_43929 [subsurface metagenome]